MKCKDALLQLMHNSAIFFKCHIKTPSSHIHLSVSSGGRWPVGEWAFLRVSHTVVQSNPQFTGAMPNESQLCSHWQVVRQTLREGRETHQQKVRRPHLSLLNHV